MEDDQASNPAMSAPARSHRVAMVVYPDAQILDVTGPLEVFSRGARWLAERRGFRVPAYTVELVASATGPVMTSSGLELVARRRWQDLHEVDTLLVAGGIGWRKAARDADLLEWLAAQVEARERIGSICTGALVLAAAGVLDGHAATTHWAYLDELARLAPGCKVDGEAIYVESGKIYTSAGVTAGIDLALGLLERDWGTATAVAVAEALVVYRRRSARQPQRSRFIEAERRADRFGALQLWILDHLDETLSVEQLAELAAMSPRNFSRQFKAHVGMTPGDFITRLRLEEACRRIDSGGAQLKDIARQCGFASEQNLRRAFRKHLGILPAEYRR